MEVTDKVRRLRQFLEATVEETRGQDLTGQTMGIEFSITSGKGGINSSEALSYLNAISEALAKFNADDVARLDFNFQIVNPVHEAIDAAVRGRMKAIIDLEANTPKLILK